MPPALRDISTNEFAELIAVMSRFLIGVAGSPLFSEGQLGLSEWVALSTLSQNEGIGNNRLARQLGVSNQRANQITSSLADAGFIVVQASQLDSRQKEIRITQAGASELALIERQLTRLLKEVLGEQRHVLPSLLKRMRRLSKLIALAKMAEKQKARQIAV